MKVAHLTSVHPAFDARIFHKECRSLAAAGHEVVLVAPHERDETVHGVRIKAIQRAKSRSERVYKTAWRVYQAALAEDADVYHFHDPELIPIGMLLAARGKHVIYDVHEDVPADVLEKPYIPRWARPLLSAAARRLQNAGAKRFSAIVAATPVIGAKFPAEKTHLVQNYPPLAELVMASPTPYNQRPRLVTYVGVLGEGRGVRELVEAMAFLPDVTLVLAGKFMPPGLVDELKTRPGWAHVDHRGWLGRPEVAALLGEARAGLVTLRPLPTYLVSQPTKLYEYMAAGLPVVASDFPGWRAIVDSASCGLLVDPLDPEAIANALTWLLDHPAEAEAMGQRGAQAVAERYNWEHESETLVSLYASLATRR